MSFRELVMGVFNILSEIIRFVLAAYYLWKFTCGDKSERETLWYGLACLIFVQI